MSAVAVKALPGSPLEVVEAEFLLHLLMRLVANPSSLDGRSQRAQIGRSGQIGKVVISSRLRRDVRRSARLRRPADGAGLYP
jgi:hypothetical protein